MAHPQSPTQSPKANCAHSKPYPGRSRKEKQSHGLRKKEKNFHSTIARRASVWPLHPRNTKTSTTSTPPRQRPHATSLGVVVVVGYMAGKRGRALYWPLFVKPSPFATPAQAPPPKLGAAAASLCPCLLLVGARTTRAAGNCAAGVAGLSPPLLRRCLRILSRRWSCCASCCLVAFVKLVGSLLHRPGVAPCAAYSTSARNIGIPTRFRVVSPLRSVSLRFGMSPRSPKCWANWFARKLEPRYRVCLPYFLRTSSTP